MELRNASWNDPPHDAKTTEPLSAANDVATPTLVKPASATTATNLARPAMRFFMMINLAHCKVFRLSKHRSIFMAMSMAVKDN